MIPLNPFRQSPGYCGPASLKILLDYFGKQYSEDELAVMCGSTREHGTDHAQLVSALQRIGEKPVEKEHATFADIRSYVSRGIPVIVGWWSVDEDHYSVVYDISDTAIAMMDPEADGAKVEMPLEEFEQVWHDFDGAENVRVDHWMLAIEHEKPTP